MPLLNDGDEAFLRSDSYLRYQVAFAEALSEFDRISTQLHQQNSAPTQQQQQQRSVGTHTLLACFSRLREVLTQYRELPLLPASLAVTAVSILSRCLRPTMPQSVHMQTLNTFEMIFEKIGPARFARDLPLYSSVLFAACRSGALEPKTMQAVLMLVQSYYLKLPGSHLQPCVGGLLLALLTLRVKDDAEAQQVVSDATGSGTVVTSGEHKKASKESGNRSVDSNEERNQCGDENKTTFGTDNDSVSELKQQALQILKSLRLRTDRERFDFLLCQTILANAGLRGSALKLLAMNLLPEQQQAMSNNQQPTFSVKFAHVLTNVLATSLVNRVENLDYVGVPQEAHNDDIIHSLCITIVEGYVDIVPPEYCEVCMSVAYT